MHAIKKATITFLINCISFCTYYLFVIQEGCFIFKFIYLSYKQLLKIISIHPYNTISHHLYTEKKRTSTIQTIVKNRIGYTSNLIFGENTSNCSLIPVNMPDIFIAKHNNVKIQGNSDFIIDKKEGVVINDFSYNTNDRFENRDGTLLRQRGNLAILKYNDKHCKRNYKSGLMLSGKYSSNYYHVMYEILIKILVLEKIVIPEDVPLVIDKIIYKIESFKQIFNTLNKTKREIILIDQKEVIFFDTLFWISEVNIIPPHTKNPWVCLPEDIVFDKSIVQKLREKLLSIKSEKIFPTKIYLSRKNTNRRKYNEDEVISLLKDLNFSIVTPEEFLFSEQIALFSRAEIIVAGSGAALTNLLFCQKNCKVICLVGKPINIPAFTTIAYFQGVNMKYLNGHSIKISDLNNIHADFYIPIEKLGKMLNQFL